MMTLREHGIYPVEFPGWNRNLLSPKGMDNCEDLPVFTDGTTCISVWKCSILHRLRILFGGTIVLWIRSGHTQPPVRLDTKIDVVVPEEEKS